jgi:hypothetical protein
VLFSRPPFFAARGPHPFVNLNNYLGCGERLRFAILRKWADSNSNGIVLTVVRRMADSHFGVDPVHGISKDQVIYNSGRLFGIDLAIHHTII